MGRPAQIRCWHSGVSHGQQIDLYMFQAARVLRPNKAWHRHHRPLQSILTQSWWFTALATQSRQPFFPQRKNRAVHTNSKQSDKNQTTSNKATVDRQITPWLGKLEHARPGTSAHGETAQQRPKSRFYMSSKQVLQIPLATPLRVSPLHTVHLQCSHCLMR